MLVCAYNVVKGGGINIVINFVTFLLSKNEKVYLLYPNNLYYKNQILHLKRIHPNFTPISFNPFFNIIIFKPLINYIYLPIFSHFLNVEKIYNFTNIGFPSLKPQFLLMHNAYVIASNKLLNQFPLKDRIYLKLMTKYILFNLSFPSKIGLQTNTIMNKLDISKRRPQDILHIPNIIDNSVIEFNPKINIDKSINLLFLSKYYPHKNFEILFKLTEKLRDNNITINLTLDKNIKSEKKILDQIKNDNDVFKNIGFIEKKFLKTVYHQNDGLFLPSLLESFSTNYIEAFKFGIPIFTSNLDFAKEVCEDCAYYFNPHDPNDIINTIKKAFQDKIELRKNIEKGKNLYLKKYSDVYDVNSKIQNSI